MPGTNITGEHALSTPHVAEAAMTKGYAVKPGTAANGIVVCDGVTDAPLGILAGTVDAAALAAGDVNVTVVRFGKIKAIVAAGVTKGTWLQTDAAGKLKTLASTGYPLAYAEETVTTAGTYAWVFVNPGGVPAA